MKSEKEQVHDFWNRAVCGENLYLCSPDRDGYDIQAARRYELEPCIAEFADFRRANGKRVLEIGVGLGADHLRFAQAEADLYGIDLAERAVEHTRRRLAEHGLSSNLATGDAEHLRFPDNWFDVVYSWGVLHHSPDTPKAVAEVWRVLKPGGTAKMMIYHKWSLVGYMLWARYAFLRMRPWLSLSAIYGRYLESPGTKAYSIPEAKQLFSAFNDVKIRTLLTHGDLLESEAGQQHRGVILSLARRIWPRRVLKRLLPGHGLFMLVEARK